MKLFKKLIFIFLSIGALISAMVWMPRIKSL